MRPILYSFLMLYKTLNEPVYPLPTQLIKQPLMTNLHFVNQQTKSHVFSTVAYLACNSVSYTSVTVEQMLRKAVNKTANNDN